jgi:hypothetical protein
VELNLRFNWYGLTRGSARRVAELTLSVRTDREEVARRFALYTDPNARAPYQPALVKGRIVR